MLILCKKFLYRKHELNSYEHVLILFCLYFMIFLQSPVHLEVITMRPAAHVKLVSLEHTKMNKDGRRVKNANFQRRQQRQEQKVAIFIMVRKLVDVRMKCSQLYRYITYSKYTNVWYTIYYLSFAFWTGENVVEMKIAKDSNDVCDELADIYKHWITQPNSRA